MSWRQARAAVAILKQQIMAEKAEVLMKPEALNRRDLGDLLPGYLADVEHGFLMNGMATWSIEVARPYLFGRIYRSMHLTIFVHPDGQIEEAPVYFKLETPSARETRRNWLYRDD